MDAFGEWRTIHHLGHGGMGVTYLAVNARTGHVKVLKTLSTDFQTDAEFLTRFRREAEVMRTLDAPKAVRHIDNDVRGHPPWMVMEYVPSISYFEFVRHYDDRGALPPIEHVLFIARDVAETMMAAHDATSPSTAEYLGIVHRDLSTTNVLVSFEGEGRVIDFGLAALGPATRVTRDSVPAGSYAYLAPEMYPDIRRASRISDVFALGLLIYDGLCAARRTPEFLHELYENPLFAQLTITKPDRYYPRMARARPDLPSEITSVVDAAIEPDQRKRTSSMGLLMVGIDRALGRLGVRVDDSRVRGQLAADARTIGAAAMALHRTARAAETKVRAHLAQLRQAGMLAPDAALSDRDLAALVGLKPGTIGLATAEPARAPATDVVRGATRRLPFEPEATRVDPRRPHMDDGAADVLSVVVPRDLVESGGTGLSEVPGWEVRASDLRTMPGVPSADEPMPVLLPVRSSVLVAGPPSVDRRWPVGAVVAVSVMGTLLVVFGALLVARAYLERPAPAVLTVAPSVDPPATPEPRVSVGPATTSPLPTASTTVSVEPRRPAARSAPVPSSPPRPTAPRASSAHQEPVDGTCGPTRLDACLAALEAEPESDVALQAYFEAATKAIDGLETERQQRARALLRAAKRARGALAEVRALHRALREPPQG